jgi:hypothetical protein
VRRYSGLAVPFVIPIPKKSNGGSDRFTDLGIFEDKRKLSSMTVPVAMLTPKMHSDNGEHTLIPVLI